MEKEKEVPLAKEIEMENSLYHGMVRGSDTR